LNHTNVVTTIPDAAYPLLSELPNEPRNVCFLSRGTSTSDDCRELGGDFDEFAPERIETELQGSLVNNRRINGRGWSLPVTIRRLLPGSNLALTAGIQVDPEPRRAP